MTDRRIIFCGPMVLALLEGRKTQTRRIITPGNSLFNGGRWSALHKRQEWDWEGAWVDGGPSPMGNPGPYLKLPWQAGDDDFEGSVHRIYPVIQPGDRLWVREAWRFDVEWDECKPSQMHAGSAILFEADGTFRNAADGTTGEPGRLRNARFMPRRFSRTTLTVTDVRVQRLQDISEEDSKAEGAMLFDGRPTWHHGWRHDYSDVWPTARHSFCALWNSLHGPEAWGANPWVYALTFTVHYNNIDAMKGGE
jgi:hypothetical protein